ncbi:MAG: hypothetical protein ACXAC7_16825 [Candidatus Hodarchaeales archaeon]|jgi:hypothetical protein
MKRPENLPETLQCQDCDYTMKAPTHCGAPMHIEEEKLVCWMGSHCGEQELPKHHNKYLVFTK